MLFRVNCAKCDYDLSGLEEPIRCPECGARDRRPAPDAAWWRRLERAGLIAALFPLLLPVVLHVMLLLARMELGRWPHRFGRDDPKFIPVVGQLHSLVIILTLLLPIALLVGVVFIPGLYVRAMIQRTSYGPPTRAFLLSLVAWGLLVVLVRFDPADVIVWFLD